jgi:hypothetical protein
MGLVKAIDHFVDRLFSYFQSLPVRPADFRFSAGRLLTTPARENRRCCHNNKGDNTKQKSSFHIFLSPYFGLQASIHYTTGFPFLQHFFTHFCNLFSRKGKSPLLERGTLETVTVTFLLAEQGLYGGGHFYLLFFPNYSITSNFFAVIIRVKR